MEREFASRHTRATKMNIHQPKNVLVTGGAGFIGVNFIRYLLASSDDISIVNFDLLTYAGSLKDLENLPAPSRHTFVQGDICDRQLVDHLLVEHSIDTIVHFAAESHVDRSISGPAPFIQTNVVGTFTLLEAARNCWLEKQGGRHGVCRFHHISTDEVYGTLGVDDAPFTEKTAYAPNSPYAASKSAADHLVRAYHHTYGLPVTTTNCSNNYGPHQHQEKFIPTVILACKQRKPIPVYGDGSNIRDWLYVEDHCRGIDTVIRHGRVGATYNIGGNNERSNIHIARTICQIMDGLDPGGESHLELITFVADRPGHDWRYAVDCRKIVEEFDWKPQETFDTGILKAIRWYLAGN